jgi:hypothetical protein
MGVSYLTNRMGLVAELLAWADRLRLPEEVAHDAVLLMDRFMSTETQARRPVGLGCFALASRARARCSWTVSVDRGAGAPAGRTARVPCEGLLSVCCSVAVLRASRSAGALGEGRGAPCGATGHATQGLHQAARTGPAGRPASPAGLLLSALQ